MSRTRYGVRDIRTGKTHGVYNKESALRACEVSITGRYVPVVWRDEGWWELLPGAPARPPRPRRAPRRGAGVTRASLPLYLRLWRKLRPDSGHEQPFVRHNG